MKLLPLIAISFFTLSALAAPAEPPTAGNRAGNREPYVDIRSRELGHRKPLPDFSIGIRANTNVNSGAVTEPRV